MPDTKKIVTVDNLDRFKNKLPTWVGSRAEHTAAEQAGTLPTNGIIGISDEEGSGGGGGGGDARSKIFKNVTVYKSSDFEPIEIGGVQYARISFPATKNGKIIMMKSLAGDYETRTGYGWYKFNTLRPSGSPFRFLNHFGNNILNLGIGNSTNSKSSTFKYNGITFTNLMDGGISVSGTAGSNGMVKLGTIYSTSIGDSSNPYTMHTGYIKVFGLSGTYSGLKIGSYMGTEAVACPIEETKLYNDTVTSFSANCIYVMLYFNKGDTYDCVFYPQITPIWGDNNHYERPFNYRGLKQTYIADRAPSGDYLNGHFGNISGLYLVDYPIIHSGVNTFILETTGNFTKSDFEIYYTEDDVDKTEYGMYLAEDMDSKYISAHYYVDNRRTTKHRITASFNATANNRYFTTVAIEKQDPVKPTSIGYNIMISTNGDFFNDNTPKEDGYLSQDDYTFVSANLVEALQLQDNSSLTADKTYICSLLCDYTGFDDSTTIT